MMRKSLKMTFITVIGILLSQFALANNLSEAQRTLKISNAYLRQIQANPSLAFNINIARQYAAVADMVCEEKSLPLNIKAEGCVITSGVLGMIAKQRGQPDGRDDGIESYRKVIEALHYNPDNKEAIFGHADALIGVHQENFLVRFFVKKTLQTTIKVEAERARDGLARIGAQDTNEYRQVLKML